MLSPATVVGWRRSVADGGTLANCGLMYSITPAFHLSLEVSYATANNWERCRSSVQKHISAIRLSILHTLYFDFNVCINLNENLDTILSLLFIDVQWTMTLSNVHTWLVQLIQNIQCNQHIQLMQLAQLQPHIPKRTHIPWPTLFLTIITTYYCERQSRASLYIKHRKNCKCCPVSLLIVG